MARMTGKVRMSESDKCSEKKMLHCIQGYSSILGVLPNFTSFLYLFLAEHRKLFSISCLKFFDE